MARVFKRRNNICVLPLASWMRYYVDDERGREENDLPQIEPIIGRDGWYYNRKLPAGSREWYEYMGQAFITYGGSGEQFRYQLSLANAHILSGRERAAYREMLKVGVPKALRKAIRRELNINDDISTLRSIKLDGLRMRERFEEFVRERNIST